MNNEFVVGEKAYVLKMNLGRNAEPEIREVEVTSIGRKYIHISGYVYGTKFFVDFPHKCESDYDMQLCSSQKEAEELIESRNMRLKLRRMDFSALKYNTLKKILALCTAEVEREGHIFSEGDIVYVSDPDLTYEKEYGERVHKNFFGKVIEVEPCITVDWGNEEEWAYNPEELSLAKGLEHMTLEDFSNTFGVCVNATFL